MFKKYWVDVLYTEKEHYISQLASPCLQMQRVNEISLHQKSCGCYSGQELIQAIPVTQLN